MLKIRPMCETDIHEMEEICLATADKSLRNTYIKRENTLFLYNRYYTRAERKSCFVATNENDKAVGYIICAENYPKYVKSFFANEGKKIFGLRFKSGIEMTGEILSQSIFAKKYPAHMHIDILPDYQGGGTGTRLLQTLLAYLKEKHIRGLMLAAGKDNIRAISFYKKNGFKVLFTGFGAVIMGIKL